MMLMVQTTELWGPQAVRGAVLSLKEQLRRLDVQLMVSKHPYVAACRLARKFSCRVN